MKKFDITTLLFKTNISTLLFKIVVSLGILIGLLVSAKSVNDLTMTGIFFNFIAIIVLIAIWSDNKKKIIKSTATFCLLAFICYVIYDLSSQNSGSELIYGIIFPIFLIILAFLAIWYPHYKKVFNNESIVLEDDSTVGRLGIWKILNEADVSTIALKLIVSLGLVLVLFFGFDSLKNPTTIGIFVDTMSIIALLAIWVKSDRMLLKSIASIGPATLTAVMLYNLYIADVNSRAIPGGMIFLFLAICVFLAIWYPLVPKKIVNEKSNLQKDIEKEKEENILV